MGTVNYTLIVGNLGQDPELRFTGQGRAVCNMSIATTHKPKDKPEQTEWHKVVAWGTDAENCSKYLKKGRLVAVQGRNVTRKWEKDGQTHYTTEVHVERVTFLGGKDSANQQQAQPAPRRAAANDTQTEEDLGPGMGDDNVSW